MRKPILFLCLLAILIAALPVLADEIYEPEPMPGQFLVDFKGNFTDFFQDLLTNPNPTPTPEKDPIIVPTKTNIPFWAALMMGAAPALAFTVIALFYRGGQTNTRESGETLWIDARGKKATRKLFYEAKDGQGIAYISVADSKSSSHMNICALVIDHCKGSLTSQKEMIRIFKKITKRYERSKNKQDVLQNSIFELNGALQSRNLCNGMASVAIILLDRGQLHWLSIGKMGIWLNRDGEEIRINRLQTVGAEAESDYIHGEISREEFEQQRSSVEVTSWIGGLEPEDVDRSFHPFTLDIGDVLRIASAYPADNGGAQMMIRFAPKEG